MPRSKDLQIAADRRAIENAEYFTACWFKPRTGYETQAIRRSDLYERVEFRAETQAAALAAARAAVVERGPDPQGRRGLVYAVTQLGWTIHVEESFQL